MVVVVVAESDDAVTVEGNLYFPRYPTPKEAAKQILNRVAFWKGVKTD